jgi:hypothetical protein
VSVILYSFVSYSIVHDSRNMNIILTCVGRFQEYILENIRQLRLLNHPHIYVITNPEFFVKFAEYREFIHLINVRELPDTFHYAERCQMDKEFREGFWALTSARFFYIYECMRKYQIRDVVHLENDVLVYYNVNVLLPMLDKSRIYMPFDTYTRNIASLVYIPNHETLEFVLLHYDVSKNDMENFAKYISVGKVVNLPIFCETPALTPDSGACERTPERRMSKGGQAIHGMNRQDHVVNCANPYSEIAFVSQYYGQFPYLFDAAAMGQYLGGVDPENIVGDTRGFVNETCVVKYDQYAFVWSNHQTHNDLYQPFLVINDNDNIFTTKDESSSVSHRMRRHEHSVDSLSTSAHSSFTCEDESSSVNIQTPMRVPRSGVFALRRPCAIPIFNLHIHAKTLGHFTMDSRAPFYNDRFSLVSNTQWIQSEYISPRNTRNIQGVVLYSPIRESRQWFDVIVPIGPNDVSFIETHTQYIQRNVLGYRNIYLVSYDDSLRVAGCITISESIFPFSKKDVVNTPEWRRGWYLQQLLKLYSPFVIPDILDTILVIDSDTIFTRPIHFIDGEHYLYGVGREYHPPYFTHAESLHPSFTRTHQTLSGIVHYMLFHRKYLKKIFGMVETHHRKPFWRVFLDCVSPEEESGASEYELYFHFMLRVFPHKIRCRELANTMVSEYSDIYVQTTPVVSCHSYMRGANAPL